MGQPKLIAQIILELNLASNLELKSRRQENEGRRMVPMATLKIIGTYLQGDQNQDSRKGAKTQKKTNSSFDSTALMLLPIALGSSVSELLLGTR